MNIVTDLQLVERDNARISELRFNGATLEMEAITWYFPHLWGGMYKTSGVLEENDSQIVVRVDSIHNKDGRRPIFNHFPKTTQQQQQRILEFLQANMPKDGYIL